MTDDKNKPIAGGAEIVRNAVLEAVEILSGQLLKRAKDDGGGITAPAIREVVDNFKTHPDAILTGLFEEYWKQCLASAESTHWTAARKFHFERIMVKCFSALLPRNDEVIEAGRHLSRRIIPGFILALQQMMSPEIYEQYGDRARILVETLRAVHGESFTWNEVYADSSCQIVVEEVLIDISHHFGDMAKRRNWLIDVVDAHMPATTNEAEKVWNFGDGNFHTLMNALYGDLRVMLDNSEARETLAINHGEEKIAALETLFNGLKQDHADLMSAGRL